MLNQENALLEIWSVDPCLPDPWQGLACNFINGSTVITDLYVLWTLPFKIYHLVCFVDNNASTYSYVLLTLLSSVNVTKIIFLCSLFYNFRDLSSSKFQGPIPPSITKLTHLKTLYDLHCSLLLVFRCCLLSNLYSII